MEDVTFELLSEYIIKVPNAVDSLLLKSLVNSVNLTGELTSNFTEEDLTLLADLHSKIFRTYHDKVMPNVTINDENNAYSLELDLLPASEEDSPPIDLGGEGKSKRFSAMLLVLGQQGSQVEFRFPAQNCTFICNQGDIIVSPPYFSHRLHAKSVGIEKAATLNLYTCMQT